MVCQTPFGWLWLSFEHFVRHFFFGFLAARLSSAITVTVLVPASQADGADNTKRC